MMKYSEFDEKTRNLPDCETLKFRPVAPAIFTDICSQYVTSVGEVPSGIVKIPAKIKNHYGRIVAVSSILPSTFAHRSDITDIVFSSQIRDFPPRAFAGCSELRRITIPKNITRILKGTFAGCDKLEDIYYEGTEEEWNKIQITHQKNEVDLGPLIPGTPVQEVVAVRRIHIPGNDALFTANIHFGCNLRRTEEMRRNTN